MEQLQDPGAAAAAPLDRLPVAVLGAGTMGRGIAQLLLQAGADVTLIDPLAAALPRAVSGLSDTFEMLAGKGRLSRAPDALLRRLTTSTDVSAAAAASWVFEAAPEDLELKRQLFQQVAAVAPGARLATNTSTLSVTAIAAACPNPEQVVGVHFFNPAPLMKLVEVVPGLATPARLVQDAVALARALGRQPVVAQDRPGFIVNRVARPFYGEALRLAGEGADARALDATFRAAGFRMGPFELLDLIGLDVNLAATISVYQAFFHEPRYRPHPLQSAMVSAGRLGRKSGRGFYDYGGGRPSAAPVQPPEPTADPPTVTVTGDNAAARVLRAYLRTAAGAALQPAADERRVDLLLDARLPWEERGPAPQAACRLVLCWAHSASAAGACGFSFLPSPAALAAAAVAPTLELLEPVTGAPAQIERAQELLTRLGIATLRLPDQAGGAAFRTFALLLNEALSAVAERLASAADIDLAMRLGVNYPAGPLEWAESLGLADMLAALQGLHAEVGAQRFAPHPLLRRLVAAGGRRLADLVTFAPTAAGEAPPLGRGGRR